ncbi:MAG: hypothetical protein J4G05_12460 [Chlorobi bacterium]|nr:hypothetical protein [Chlorobiota bacterium]
MYNRKKRIRLVLGLIGLFLVMINPVVGGEYATYSIIAALTASVIFFTILMVIAARKFQRNKNTRIGPILALIGLFLVMINPINSGEYTVYIRIAASVFFFTYLMVVLVRKFQGKPPFGPLWPGRRESRMTRE